MPLHVKALEHDRREEFDGFYAIYSTAFPPSEQKPREVLLAMCHASFYTIYLAYNDEKIVGFCIMYHPWNEDFFCWNIWRSMRRFAVSVLARRS